MDFDQKKWTFPIAIRPYLKIHKLESVLMELT